MKRNLLKLFVTGRTQRAQEAVRNLRAIYKRLLSEDFDMVVIDVLENPEEAEKERILATPTLIRSTEESGESARRIVGDLSDTDQVLKLLNVEEIDTSAGKNNITVDYPEEYNGEE
ncbi:MAG: circadian clock KaiB family protein [Spirochaetia bacterium]